MKYYNSRSAPCFSGECEIKMSNGMIKKVKDLRKGDAIQGGAKILCILKTLSKDGLQDLCSFSSGLIITPWHPIRHNGSWTFPCDLIPSSLTPCPAVYSLIVDQGHIALINGVEVICLGHNLTDGILKHAYFGSQKIVQDIKKMPGWEKGEVQL